ncbi:hypothetical protein [Halococcus hamelinensis]|nr:hypothetical protein [Halococcus hamelinensis]
MKDDLTTTIDNEDTDFTPGDEYQTRRYDVSGTMDLEFSMAIAKDLSGLEALGMVDSDGKMITSGTEKWIGFGEDRHLEWAYWSGEPDYENADIVADSEILNRFSDVKLVAPEFDPSESPYSVSMTGWVEGDFYVNYPGYDAINGTDGGTGT